MLLQHSLCGKVYSLTQAMEGQLNPPVLLAMLQQPFGKGVSLGGVRAFCHNKQLG